MNDEVLIADVVVDRNSATVGISFDDGPVFALAAPFAARLGRSLIDAAHTRRAEIIRERLLAQFEADVTDDEDPDFLGVGLIVDDSGALAIAYNDDQRQVIVPVTDIEAGNLAAMIDAVLA